MAKYNRPEGVPWEPSPTTARLWKLLNDNSSIGAMRAVLEAEMVDAINGATFMQQRFAQLIQAEKDRAGAHEAAGCQAGRHCTRACQRGAKHR